MRIDQKIAEEIIKLSQNENPLGPSPLALQAVLDKSNLMNRYPEPHSISLKRALADHHGLGPDNIFVCAGLVESLDIMIRNFVGKGENLIIPKLTFVAYRLLAEVFGVETRFSQMKEYKIDIDSVIENYDDQTKLIIIANPNNPTGTIITEEELIRLLESVSPHTLVVVDEAYYEYVSDKDYPRSLDLQKKYPNLIVLRTFSKIFGLAGLRVGYAIATKEIIEQFEYYQPPFTVNRVAAVAVAAAIKDVQFVEDSFKKNLEARNLLHKELSALGYRTVPSQSNFIFIHFDKPEERDLIFNLLNSKNVLTRKMGPFGDFKAFRITIPRLKNCQKVIHCFRNFKNTNAANKKL
ncbi:MAG: histidinol-phosphate transaminase [Bacteroidetes bacterium]|nr:histidinol-phosphate transaminase [Bacteroidota bacterium]